ncbi:MAG: tRNA pseudouridine(38-40) synthase TruA [Alphaproteobacteria bacterium]|nr:tRNA pseudouridine(38-40) synthase TruA [Alphaproteobacteria bacterium]
MKQRWKLTVEYDGTPFCGWQIQDNLPTVQQVVENALKSFCQQDIRVQCAGRTDAGVHAWGQVAHLDLDYGDRDLRPYEFAKAINAHMRGFPVSVVRAEKVTDDFHARFGAKTKHYRYLILNRKSAATFDENRAWWLPKKLDIGPMQEAARYLVGTHNFNSFRAAACQSNNPVRTIDEILVSEQNYDDFGGKLITIDVKGQSFLHHMVRNIAGTLAVVGKKHWTPVDVKNALDAKDRTKGGPTAPAYGLYLVKINYDKENNI